MSGNFIHNQHNCMTKFRILHKGVTRCALKSLTAPFTTVKSSDYGKL